MKHLVKDREVTRTFKNIDYVMRYYKNMLEHLN